MTVSLDPAAPSRRPWRWLPWIGLVVVVAVALVIGSQRSGHPTLGQRTTAIANAVRCPVCVGETAAESNTPASVEIRVYIRQSLQAGDSRTQILSHLASSYGQSILEKPTARGINLLLWVLPGLAVVTAIAGLIVAFRRWRPALVDRVSDDDRRLVGHLLGPEVPSARPGAAAASRESGASRESAADPGAALEAGGGPPVRSAP